MPPKRDTDVSNVNDSNLTLSQEQFRELLAEIRNSSVQMTEQIVRNSRKQTQVDEEISESGNFVNCTAKFDGSNSADVEAFLDNVITYKDCSRVSDKNALRGLAMLLEGTAATWWQGIKPNIQTWDNAVATLREVYSKKLPPHRIFREIFAHEQEQDEHTELFICKVRALIAQLPYMLQEQVQLDIVYGLLARKIRKRITRDDVQSFKELVSRTRAIEQSLLEEQDISHKRKEDQEKNKKIKDRVKCQYCHRIGHSINECRTKISNEKRSETKTTADNNLQSEKKTDRPTIRCYGCNAPGVIRANCQNCSNKNKEAQTNTGTFYGAEVEVEEKNKEVYPRPILAMQIMGLMGTAVADTGASRSIMGKNCMNE